MERTQITWTLKSILIKNECVNQEIKGEFKKFTETNENENATVQNLWDAAKDSPERKVQSNMNLSHKTRKVSSTHPNVHQKELEKEQQRKPKPSRRREIIKIRADLNEIETKRTGEQSNKSRSLFSERINKIDKTLARLDKKKRERIQINKIMNERGV